MKEKQLLDLLILSHVPRWTIIATSRQQSVAEHSHRVAAITVYLLDKLNPNGDNYNAVVWAIIHDGPEAITGDIPTPFKRLLQKGAYELTEMMVCNWYSLEKSRIPSLEKDVVSLSDTIEAISFISKWGIGSIAERIAKEMEDRLYKEVNLLKKI